MPGPVHPAHAGTTATSVAPRTRRGTKRVLLRRCFGFDMDHTIPGRLIATQVTHLHRLRTATPAPHEAPEPCYASPRHARNRVHLQLPQPQRIHPPAVHRGARAPRPIEPPHSLPADVR